MTRRSLCILLATSFILACAGLAPAAADGLKARMKARLPKIQRLKAQGVIGEGSDGYLHLRRPDPQAKALVEAENRDRNTVYALIAKKTNAPADLVARRRAAQLFSQAAPGHWLRRDDGSWFQKR